MSESATVQERERASTRVQEGCPECSASVVVEGDEKLCTECGLVVGEDRLDRGKEWRAFDASEYEERSRTGAPLTEELHDLGLSTEIGWRDPDNISDGRRFQLARMRKWQDRLRWSGKEDWNTSYALGEIRRVSSALGIDESRCEQACKLFKTYRDGGLQGDSLDALAPASVYAVARVHGDPLHLEEIASVARVDLEDVTSAYGRLNQELGIPAKPPEPRQYVPGIADELGLDVSQRRSAERLAERYTPQCRGCNPCSVAAAAVYVATDDSVVQAAAADAADVSTITVRTHAKAIARLDGREADFR